MIENATLEKRFEVAVQPACARRFGFPSTKRSPSLSSVPEARPLAVDGDDLGPGLLDLADPRMKRPEPDEADGVDEDGIRAR